MLREMATLLGTILVALFLQQPAPKPLAFEVAMIKPTAPEVRGGAIKPMPSGQGYMAQGIPLKLMIRLMYTITDSQVVGGPDWINTDRWDVQAKAPPGRVCRAWGSTPPSPALTMGGSPRLSRLSD